MKEKTHIDYSKYLMFAAVIFIMLCGFLIARKKNQAREVSKLPFYNVELETVEDGTYYGKTYTSFLHLALEVTVKDHKLVKIDVLENDGIDGEKARPIIDKMIAENKVVVTAIKGAELGSIQYISCVDSALAQKTDE